jgi:nicotinamidase/pyrazinamidase
MSTVFFDSDTQIDFLYPAGALYVPGAERLLQVFQKLNQHAAAHGIPVISPMDAHAENDPEFAQWPPHCVAGTAGQQKPAATLLDPRVAVGTAPAELSLAGVRQVIVEKQQLDAFSNPNLPRVLEQLGTERCVVYGVVTEYCVRLAVLGLARMGISVEVVTDAICSLSEADARRTFEEFKAAGARMTTVAEVTSA